jgi:hypothetical protein
VEVQDGRELNLYSYSSNNPVKKIDPDGLQDVMVSGPKGGSVGFHQGNYIPSDETGDVLGFVASFTLAGDLYDGARTLGKTLDFAKDPSWDKAGEAATAGVAIIAGGPVARKLGRVVRGLSGILFVKPMPRNWPRMRSELMRS